MEANQEFTATTLERLQQLLARGTLSTPSPTARCGRGEPVSLFGALGPCKAGCPRSKRPSGGWPPGSDGDMTTDPRWKYGIRAGSAPPTAATPGRDRRQPPTGEDPYPHLPARARAEARPPARRSGSGRCQPIDPHANRGRGERAGGPRGLRTPRAAGASTAYEVHPDYALEMPQSSASGPRQPAASPACLSQPTHHPAAGWSVPATCGGRGHQRLRRRAALPSSTSSSTATARPGERPATPSRSRHRNGGPNGSSRWSKHQHPPGPPCWGRLTTRARPGLMKPSCCISASRSNCSQCSAIFPRSDGRC